jgi:hypothetical protein
MQRHVALFGASLSRALTQVLGVLAFVGFVILFFVRSLSQRRDEACLVVMIEPLIAKYIYSVASGTNGFNFCGFRIFSEENPNGKFIEGPAIALKPGRSEIYPFRLYHGAASVV